MKMPSYLESRAKAYGRLEELKVDPTTARLVPQVGASELKQ
jgi:hypothetical protein